MLRLKLRHFGRFFFKNLSFYLNHAEIETALEVCWLCCSLCFYLNHAEIETQLNQVPSRNSRFFYLNHAEIETNFFCVHLWYCRLPSTWIMLRLKLCVSFFIFDMRLLLLESCWDWNFFMPENQYICKCFYLNHAEIETEEKRIKLLTIYNLLLESCWDWNKERSRNE